MDQEITSSGKESSFGLKLLVPLSLNLVRSGFWVSEKALSELRAARADEAMDGIHWSPLTHVGERPRPRQCVQVIGVDQGAVDIKQYPRPGRRHSLAPWPTGS